MIFDEYKQQVPDIDPAETKEWLQALELLVEKSGRGRAHFLIYKLLKQARSLGIGVARGVQTPYINTIPPENEPWFPGDEDLEKQIRRLIRWNAAVMVIRANRRHPGLGGHLSTYASSAGLIEVGINHFFRGKNGDGVGDQVFFQGHAAPGLYSRAFLEGRLTEAQLDGFRQEISAGGLPSYPHPRLLPDFWEFPTVSMGLSPINAVYQARFNRYLHNRSLCDTGNSRVWCFLGDGECDEPETLGALSLASREGLDNLVFVVNCNLQRLDGPVRGNGKIIQELEAVFRGAGWNVIKIIWGREWDDLLSRDTDGVLIRRMNETLDGDYQRYSIEKGSYIREHFFGPDHRLRRLAEHLDDAQLQRLRRGGHDYRKVYAAYRAAVEGTGAPTVILAKTVKGWALGKTFEGRNATHQKKLMDDEELRMFRDTLQLPIPDSKLQTDDPPYYHPGPESKAIRYMLDRRSRLGGFVPSRVVLPVEIRLPRRDLYAEFHEGTGGKVEVSTTMAFVRLLRKLLKNNDIGRRVVPIIPDEARTFGMESLFREFKIYAALGQKYRPVDAEMLLSYTEGRDGQILEEGITEAGGMASFTAAGTAYATHRQPMIPFYIFYSMFGFQRFGDLAWAFGDARGRGFLMGATAGRTTLSGEGLQHQDGHSLLQAAQFPSCLSYDPAFAYEIAVIVEEGLRRMYEKGEDIFYYITLYNENYGMPPMPDGAREGILRGLYRFEPATGGRDADCALLGSGTILTQALAAKRILEEEFQVFPEVWAAPSFSELRREALECEESNRLHPDKEPRLPYVSQCLRDKGPVVAASDFVKAWPDLIARWVPSDYAVLGTDGFGRSDTRKTLRRHFQVDAEHIAAAALSALARAGRIGPDVAREYIGRSGLVSEAPAPARVPSAP